MTLLLSLLIAGGVLLASAVALGFWLRRRSGEREFIADVTGGNPLRLHFIDFPMLGGLTGDGTTPTAITRRLGPRRIGQRRRVTRSLERLEDRGLVLATGADTEVGEPTYTLTEEGRQLARDVLPALVVAGFEPD